MFLLLFYTEDHGDVYACVKHHGFPATQSLNYLSSDLLTSRFLIETVPQLQDSEALYKSWNRIKLVCF